MPLRWCCIARIRCALASFGGVRRGMACGMDGDRRRAYRHRARPCAGVRRGLRTARPRKHVVQSAATLAGAYGAYTVADYFGWSGIFAVLVFGIALRELERHRITVSSASGVAVFWHRLSSLANVVLFFLIGAALDLTRLRTVCRAPGLPLRRYSRRGRCSRTAYCYGARAFAPGWQTVVRMAGIRGALSLALAFATPAAIPQRGAVIDATFAVVVVTILLERSRSIAVSRACR